MDLRFVLIVLSVFLVKNTWCQPVLSSANHYPDTITVPLGGNTFSSNNERRGGNINNEGIINWTDVQTYFTTYVRTTQPGMVKLWLQLKAPGGKSRIQVGIKGKAKDIAAEGTTLQDYYAGEWKVNDTGYIPIVIKGLSKTGAQFAHITHFKLTGTAIDKQTAYVKNDEGNFFYWGRRGPSVHLSYTMPQNVNAEWFYNEVTVPKGEDVTGSYFMANGFGEGYFGIQVNSATERRILFSVWSPFQTDDPKAIPDSMKIQLLKKGEGVHAGEFGNEGSGGQSYLKYYWKAGTTYRFLLHGVPDGTHHTTYTAYFYAPEKGNWMLIASFRRPQTNTYLKRFHSFLENFIPEQGNIERKVLFTNQWIRTDKGEWLELNQARFTGDNTAVKGYRMDYGGGVQQSAFYLRNCGFFSDYTPLRKLFERPLSGQKPDIQFDQLP